MNNPVPSQKSELENRKKKYNRFSETYNYLSNALQIIEERKQSKIEGHFNNAEIAAITIISKNYCAFGLTLCRSYLKHHPGSKFFVIICDKDSENLCQDKVKNAGGIPILLDELLIPQKEIIKIRYSILELNTAIKPFALEYCLKQDLNIKAIAYIDPDIKIFNFLLEVWNSLIINSYEVCLTPHILNPINDDNHPSELSILQSGTYNLGFIGLRRSNFCMNFLSWWQQRLYLDCVVDIPRGLFTDQKWIDLIPGFCEKCFIIKDYTYNVAYWNLHERKISQIDDIFHVNNKPLAFFHFSGFNPKKDIISKHQNRFNFRERPDLVDIFKNYKESLFENFYEEAINYEYSFSKLEKKIDNNTLFRFLMMKFTREQIKFPSPVENIYDFSKFILEPRIIDGDSLSFFQYGIIKLRPDVYDFFQIKQSNIRTRFSQYKTWLENTGFHELGLEGWEKYLIDESLINELSSHPLEELLSINKKDFSVKDNKKEINKFDLKKDFNALLDLIDIKESRKNELIEYIINSVNKLVGIGLSRIDLQGEFDNFLKVEDISRYINWLITEKRNHSSVYLCEILSLKVMFVFMPTKLIEIFKIKNSLKITSRNYKSRKKLINFAGQFSSVKGTGEGARSLSRALEIDGNSLIKYINICSPFDSDDVFLNKKGESYQNSFYKNSFASIFSFNADNSQYALSMVPKDFLSDKNIAYWAWETENLPEYLSKFNKFFDQIWAVSNYTRDAIIKSVDDKKVFTIPHCIDPYMLDNFTDLCSLKIKEKLKTLNGFFSFGFILDFHSFGIRKNPEGLFKVFEKIYEKNKDIILVIKVSGVDFGDYEYEKLKAKFIKLNCIFIEENLSKADVYYFLSKIDCYISLHRAEGFGLPLLEAMSLGTFTMATNYSGNLDFMNDKNSVLIDTKPFTLDRDFGPYEKGTIWREPNIDECIEKIRFFMDSVIERSRLAVNGENFVKKQIPP